MKITVNLQSALAPTISTVYLQIYNVVTDIWETLDFNDIYPASTPFDLIGRITSNQANYYDDAVSDTNFPETYALNEVTIRVYQLNI